jgi:prevent-host-death family protein
MQSVNVAELKNHLSHYLRRVQQGDEITIKERNRVIARIVLAAPAADYDQELLELAAQGKVKLPEKPLDEETFNEMLNLKLPRVKARGKAARELLQRIMDEERGDY